MAWVPDVLLAHPRYTFRQFLDYYGQAKATNIWAKAAIPSEERGEGRPAAQTKDDRKSVPEGQKESKRGRRGRKGRKSTRDSQQQKHSSSVRQLSQTTNDNSPQPTNALSAHCPRSTPSKPLPVSSTSHWVCPLCTYHNPLLASPDCEMCGCPNPSDAYSVNSIQVGKQQNTTTAEGGLPERKRPNQQNKTAEPQKGEEPVQAGGGKGVLVSEEEAVENQLAAADEVEALVAIYGPELVETEAALERNGTASAVRVKVRIPNDVEGRDRLLLTLALYST
jgi:hypothetical protein